MEKQLTKQQVSQILNSAPQNLDKKVIIQKLVEKGYSLEGFQQPQTEKTIEQQRQERRDQGLPVAQNPNRVEPTWGGEIVRAPLKLLASAEESIRKPLGAMFSKETYSQTPDQSKLDKFDSMKPIKSDYLGDIYPLGYGVDKQGKDIEPLSLGSVKKGAGQAAEIVSYAVGGEVLGALPSIATQGFKGAGTQLLKQSVPLIKEGALAGGLGAGGVSMQEGNNFGKVAVDTLGGVLSGGILAPVAALGFKGLGAGTRGVMNRLNTRTDTIIPPTGGVGGSGVVQIVSDIANRVPRAASRIKQNIATASERSAKIKTSTPAIQSAMKSNLDDRIINTIDSADDATRKAYRDVVDIAQEQSTKLGTKTQPTKVGGDLAAEQYSIIDKQKKTIGAKLGEETKKLSQNADIEMGDSYSIIDDTLSSQGIMPQYTKKGVKLDFSGSKYTPAERTKIQELYKLATEGGDKLSALQIKGKDQLFSKLKRESNFEGVGNIIIDTPNGQRSLFDVFRDIYSSKLDTLSPEIKALNSQYRKLSNLTEDIENSILKTPNFNITKLDDPAEFAKVNLRRIFGESQSSPAYEAIADAMDATSRSLGYKGASPKVVAEFAQEMRKLFPDTIPATGFSGGVKLGIGDIIEKVTSLGATNLTDKQKAIVELLESYQKAKKLNIRNK